MTAENFSRGYRLTEKTILGLKEIKLKNKEVRI